MRLLLLVIIIGTTVTCAQDSVMVKVIMQANSQKKQIIMDGITYDLFDATALEKVVNLKITCDSLRRENAAKDTLIATLNTVPEQCSTTVAAKNEYISALSDMVHDYKNLYSDAKKLITAKEPKLTFEGAIGAGGANGLSFQHMDKPMLLAGLGFRKFKASLLLQENNVGILVGGVFRLF